MCVEGVEVGRSTKEAGEGKVGVNREGCRWEGKSRLPNESIVEDICVNCGKD